MERTTSTRRDFLKSASLALTVPLIIGCNRGSAAQRSSDDKLLNGLRSNAISDPKDEWWGARHAPANLSWRTKLSTSEDKGEQILVSGTVYEADGTTPAPGTLIYLYHTDIYGVYGRSGEHRHGRYRGWMLTDERGRYELQTIMPASYPNSTIAKHIHMTVTTKDLKEDWVDSILFEGDKFLTERDRTIHRGGFNSVLKLTQDNGLLRGVRDIRLWA